MQYTNHRFRFISISMSPAVDFFKLDHLVSMTETISRTSK